MAEEFTREEQAALAPYVTNLAGPVLSGGQEFLQGFHLQASNISELAPAVAANVEQGAIDYYAQADPRSARASFNLFKSKNKFGQPLGARTNPAHVAV